MSFLQVRFIIVMLIMAPYLMAQTMVTTVVDTGGVDQNAVIQILRGSGSGASIAAVGGNIDPSDPQAVVADHEVYGISDGVMAGNVLLSSIVEQGDDLDPNDPEGFALVIRVRTASGQSTYIVAQGNDLDPNDPEGLATRTIVIHTPADLSAPQTIVEEVDDLDPNDPEGLMAAKANGATIHRMFVGPTDVITVIDQAAVGNALLIRVYHTRF